MVRIYSSEDRVNVHHLRNVLEAAGVQCLVKNDSLFTLAGEIPAVECWPELWLLDESMLNKAESVIQDQSAKARGINASWQCACGELNEGQFTECWRCGSELIEQ